MLSVYVRRMLLLLLFCAGLTACDTAEITWTTHRVPAEMDTYTLQGLELTEEIRFVEGEPTLFLQLAVTEPVMVQSLEAHYAYFDYNGMFSSDRRAQLESQSDDLTAQTSQVSLRVPIETRYEPSDEGERDVIGSYLLPLGEADPRRLIGYRVIITLDNEAGMYSNGKLIRIDNNSVYRPRD